MGPLFRANARPSANSFLDLAAAPGVINPRGSTFIPRHMSACSDKEEAFGANQFGNTSGTENNGILRPSFSSGIGISEMIQNQQRHKMSIDFTNINRPDQK